MLDSVLNVVWFNFVYSWKLRSLASQLCGLFVEVEGAQFESRLSDTLPLIEQQLEPGKYKQVIGFICVFKAIFCCYTPANNRFIGITLSVCLSNIL